MTAGSILDSIDTERKGRGKKDLATVLEINNPKLYTMETALPGVFAGDGPITGRPSFLSPWLLAFARLNVKGNEA